MTMDGVQFDDAIAEATHLGPWTTCTICDLSAMCFYETCHNDGHWVEIDFPDASDMADCRDQCIATNQATSFQYNDGGWCELYKECGSYRSVNTDGDTYRRSCTSSPTPPC